jgi:hypothetical protein
VELQEIGKKLQVAQDKAHKFKEVMSTLPPAEMVTPMVENTNIYLEMNQIRVEQKACTQKIETLHEEAYKVTRELEATQGMFKQVAQESVEKLKTRITAEMDEEIVQKEMQVNENITTARDTFHKFLETWKKD